MVPLIESVKPHHFLRFGSRRNVQKIGNCHFITGKVGWVVDFCVVQSASALEISYNFYWRAARCMNPLAFALRSAL